MFGSSVSAAYSTRALVCLARHEDWVRGSKVIASCSGAPRPYLVKVLHCLAHEGLVETRRGNHGGYRLARSPETITLFDILSTVDGPDVFERCFLGFGKCTAKRGCPLHAIGSKQRACLKKRYRELTLRELASFDRLDFQRNYHFGRHGRKTQGGT